jgi:hypothetical protein
VGEISVGGTWDHSPLASGTSETADVRDIVTHLDKVDETEKSDRTDEYYKAV